MHAVQVQAFIRGNAVDGVVQAALESEGTPNELLQTDLTQAGHHTALNWPPKPSGMPCCTVIRGMPQQTCRSL